MRLWHKELIPALPRQQLLGQWRECCCIASNIAKDNTPNHILVNKILDYDISHFHDFTNRVISEMKARGYKVDISKFWKHFPSNNSNITYGEELYKLWHNKRYLTQCFHNLEEKFDCGGMTETEWKQIKDVYEKF